MKEPDSLTFSIDTANSPASTNHASPARDSIGSTGRHSVTLATTSPRKTSPHAAASHDVNVSLLPSTVPETLDDGIAEAESLAESMLMAIDERASTPPAVDDPSQDGRGETQQLSPGTAELARSRSAALSREQSRTADANEGGDYHESLQEGDSNFLDIASSFAVPHADGEFDPINLSPTQTQQPLTQFPESQRFRTPATAGRKRDRAGNFVDTPVVSRNPFAHGVQQTPGNGMGLSQAFAQTQAASSPMPLLATSVMRSDRPSPDLQIERHVARPATSSPTRLLSDWTRIATEPSSRYVSMKDSQTRRTRRLADVDGGATQTMDDNLDSGDSIISKNRRAREREADAKERLKAASSPISSPIKQDLISTVKRATSEKPARAWENSSKSLPSSPPLIGAANVDGENDENDGGSPSNEQDGLINELDEASDAEQPISRTSGRNVATTVIPNTTKRINSGTSRLFPPPQPSPSVRQSRYRGSAESVRILNSQESAPSTQGQAAQRPARSTLDSVDVIPASQPGQLVATQPSNLGRIKGLGQGYLTEESMESEAGPTGLTSLVHGPYEPPVPGSTIPESIIPRASTGSTDQERPLDEDPEVPGEAAGAPHPTVPEFSSQPILPPPGKRRRRRMEEVSQEQETMTLASQISTFDAIEGLALHDDPDTAKFLETDIPQKRAKTMHTTIIPQLQVEETRASSQSPDLRPSRQLDEDLSADDIENCESRENEASMPLSVQKDSVELLAKRSAWDIGVSPKQKHAPRRLGPRSQPEPHRQQERASGRSRGRPSRAFPTTQSTLPSLEDASPDPIAIAETPQGTPAEQPNEESVKAADMVLAYYMGRTRAYYPAKCLDAMEETKKFTIKWPGYDAEILESHMICSLDLRVGDEVKVDRNDFPKTSFVIRGFSEMGSKPPAEHLTDIYGHDCVLLEPKQPKNHIPKAIKNNTSVPIRDIYIGPNMWRRMIKRPFVYKKPEMPKAMSGISTPPVRSLTPTTPSSRGRHVKKELILEPNAGEGIFSNMAFALSFEEDYTRNEIRRLVRENGGTLLEQSFQELLTDGFDVKPQFQNTTFTALLADRHSRKPKYMEALALGLPCLSGKWLSASLKQSKPAFWQDYLLPAGESTELGGAVRSRIMPAIYNPSDKLAISISHRPQFFEDSVAIFVTGKGKTADRRESHFFFVQAMGATDIKKVVDLNAAKAKLRSIEEDKRIWLFVDDKDREEAAVILQEYSTEMPNAARGKKQKGRRSTAVNSVSTTDGLGCLVADSEFIVQSLIFGKLLSLHRC